MNITITFEHEDLLKYVKDLLAVKGLRPKGDIEFRQQKGSKQFTIAVDCEPAPLLEACPMCQSKLVQGAPVAERTKSVEEAPAPSKPTLVVAEERSYPVDEDGEPVDPMSVIDPELGETFDPPSPGEGAPSVSVSKPSEDEDGEGGGSMASLLAANKRLTAQRTRELEERKRAGGQASPRMAGESTRPPKPGEGM